MNLKRGISWFTRFRGRGALRRRAPDLGDMGTTSALDAALPSLNDASLNVLRAKNDEFEQKQAGGDHRPTRPARL